MRADGPSAAKDADGTDEISTDTTTLAIQLFIERSLTEQAPASEQERSIQADNGVQDEHEHVHARTLRHRAVHERTRERNGMRQRKDLSENLQPARQLLKREEDARGEHHRRDREGEVVHEEI